MFLQGVIAERRLAGQHTNPDESGAFLIISVHSIPPSAVTTTDLNDLPDQRKKP